MSASETCPVPEPAEGSRALERIALLEAENARLRQQLREREAAEAQVRYALDHDPITGLPNRRMLVEQLQRALHRARVDRSAVAVIALQLRDLAAIQAMLDTAALHKLLVAAAFRVRQNVRPMDTVVRADEDLLAIMLTATPDEVGEIADFAAAVARRTQDALLGEVWVDGELYPVPTRTALVVSPEDGDNAFELLHRLQARLARVDEARDGALPERAAHAAGLSVVEQGLRKALDRALLVPYFQPQVTSGGERIIGAEALARWPLPDGRFVSPNVFVPAADLAGITAVIDDAMLVSVCDQIARWQGRYPQLRVAVNVSAPRFHHPDLVRRVREVLDESGARPEQLLFEITESVVITDFEEARRTLGGLRDLGIAIALDDFGTGHSSLSYLRRLPLDAIKIDQSFVHEVGTEGGDIAVIKAVVAIAESMKLQVIAEGIETPLQARILRGLGCEVLQGFLYGEAVPADRFEKLLASDAAL